MTDRRDPEVVAITAVMRAIAALDRDAQRRVLSYAGERLDSDLTFSTLDLMASCSAAFNAINKAALELNRESGESISGLELVQAVLAIYRQGQEVANGQGVAAGDALA